MIQITLTPGIEPLLKRCRVMYSVRKHGGYFVDIHYSLERGTMRGLEVITPPDAGRWSCDPAKWDQLPRASELPTVWTTVEARPRFPEDELWIGPLLRGLAERVEWWAKEKHTAVNALLTVLAVRIHPTDTSPGICEHAGQQMMDEIIELLAHCRIH